MSECDLSSGEYAAATEHSKCIAEGERTGLLVHGMVLTGPMVRALGEYMMAVDAAATIGITMEEVAAAGAYGEALDKWRSGVAVEAAAQKLGNRLLLQAEEAIAGIPHSLLATSLMGSLTERFFKSI